MKNEKYIIVQKATMLFSQRGTQAISMTDIAAECGISKKTLYQFFENKDMLVSDVINSALARTCQYLGLYTGISPDAVTELMNFFGSIEKLVGVFTPAFLRDITRHFPGACDSLRKFESQELVPFLYRNISRGVTEELYRTDMKKETAARFYCWGLRKAMEEHPGLPATGDPHFVNTINNFFIHSLVNARGKRMLVSK